MNIQFGRILAKIFIAFSLLCACFSASAADPYIISATIKVTAPLENGAKVSYGGSDVWVDYTFNDAGLSSTSFKYKLWEQYNNGTWVLVRNSVLGWQINDWFYTRPKPLAIGTYKYRLLVSKDGSLWNENAAVDTDIVTVRAPRTAPSAAFTYFQIQDVWGYRGLGLLEEKSDKYIFHKDNGAIVFTWSHLANDIALRTDLYYEFLSRKLDSTTWKVDKVNSNIDSFQWVPFENGVYGLNDLETYEFAIRACNPYGCTATKYFYKPVLIDYPDVTTIPPLNQYSQITGADLWFEVYDDVTRVTNLQNYCLADPINRKCRASTGRIVGRVDGVKTPGTVYLYKGTVLSKSTVGTGTVFVTEAVKDLPVGIYSFVLKSAGGAEGAFLRKRFYVYVPNEGTIEASPCTINPTDTSCTTPIAWKVSGDYPSCLFQIDGSIRVQLACVSGGGNQIQNTIATVGVTASQFEIVAKEPTAERVIAKLNLGANFKDVSLSATPERCDIIRPATSCLTRISWKASADYSPCLYKGSILVSCSNESQLEILVSNPSGTQFKLLNGQYATDKLLAQKSVLAVKPPTGSLTVASGSQSPCIPNNTNTCTVNVTMSHYGGYMGVSLYKDGQAWANLGTSGEAVPVAMTKALTVNTGGTTYAMKATVEGQLYEIASITLYTTTYTSQGYSLSATPNECTYNPITETGCKPVLTWAFPAADACIFQDNKVVFCPDSSFLNGSSPNTLPLAAGNRLYQIRKGNTPTGALVAQVGVLSKEQTIADIKAQSSGCYNASCKIELNIFSNYPDNVCLYDNGVKVIGYCNLNRHNYISDYVTAPGMHKLELKLEANGQVSVVAETSIELQYVPVAPSNITAVSNGNAIDVSWSASPGAISYILERNGFLVSDSLLFNTYNDAAIVSGITYTYRVKACLFSTFCSGWITATPVVFIPSSNSSSSSSSSSSASSAPPSTFKFDTDAPASFKYSLNESGVPDLGASQNVAATQGDIKVSNGAALYSVKMDLPPAVKDLKPSLSLSYNSRSGNGLMGVGWNLSGLSSITRCRASFSTEGGNEVQKAKPRYSKGDRLCLDGQKLVLDTPSGSVDDDSYWATGAVYKTEIDNFSKIKAYGSSFNGGHSYFKVLTKDGRTLTYGGQDSSQNSRIPAAGQSAGAISVWALDKVEDAYNNNYTISYDVNAADGDYRPLRINFAPEGAVVFTYHDRLGQVPSGYDMGYQFQHKKILDKVTTYIGVTSPTNPESGTPVKKYDIEYQLSPDTQRERVRTISECGYVNGSWKCAKPLTFDWQTGEFGVNQTGVNVTHCNGLPITEAIQQVADIDGDGYNDIIFVSGTISAGSAQGCFDPPGVPWKGSGFPAGYTTDSSQLIMTSTGYGIISHISSPIAGTNSYNRAVGITYSTDWTTHTTVFKLIVGPTQGSISPIVVTDFNNDGLGDFTYLNQEYTQIAGSVPNFTSTAKTVDAYTMFVDLDGDGLKDSLVSNPNLTTGKVMAASGFSTWNFNFEVSSPEPQVYTNGMGPTLHFQGSQTRILADINGDGLQDFVYHREDSSNNGIWYYRLNKQTGSADNENSSGVVAALPNQIYKPHNFYGYNYDYDKDGRDDLITIVPSGSQVCQLRILLARDNSSGGIAFQEATANGSLIIFTPPGDNIPCAPHYQPAFANIFAGDLNNDGVVDMYYSGKVYFGKPKQPDLLVKVTDGFNAEVALEYSTLTGDLNNGKPLYTPDSVAPVFPQVPASRNMQVVKKLSVSNGLNGYSDRFYNYAGAKTDVQGRGFLGFANIQTTDVATGITTSTDYRQSFPYIGRVDNVTTKTISGDLISSAKNFYAIHPGNPRFPYVDYSLQKTYQLTTTNLDNPLSATKVKNTYDVCGNLTEQISDTGSGLIGAVVTGVLSHVRVANDVKYYGTLDCNDDFVYRTTKEASKTSVNDDLRVTITEFEPNNAKEVAQITAFKGTPQQKVTIIDRATNGVVIGTSEVANDIDGTITDPRVTNSTDLAKGLFPKTITNVLSSGNHVTTVDYDYRFGVESSITLPNAQKIIRTYDYLGRLTDESKNDGTHSEIISFYCSNAPVACPDGSAYGVATRVTNTNLSGTLGAPLIIVYYDKLQREVRNSIYSMDGKAINIDKQYQPNGRLSAVSEPFINGTYAKYWTTYSDYDALGRPHTVRKPDNGSHVNNYEKSGTNIKVTEMVTVIGKTTNTQITQRYINPLGQIAQVIDANNTPVDYIYNSTGNLQSTKVNDNASTLISIEYDNQGNKSHIVDPDAGEIDFDYSGFGELRRQTWQKKLTGFTKSMVLSYDQLGRQITRVDNPVTGSPATYTWIWDTKQKGRLTSESGNNKSVTYGYDGFSRVNSSTISIQGLTNRIFAYDYDNYGRPTSVTYPNGYKITRKYHAAGMAVQTTDNTDALNPRILWALGNGLDDRGNFKNQLWGNGVITQTGFDGRNGQLTSIKSGRLTSAGVTGLNGDIQALSYEYDTAGNLQSRTSQRTNAVGVALENIREEFAYDNLNRLKTSTSSGLFARYNDYSYDELGNLKSRTSKQGTSTVNDDVGILSYEGTNNAGVHAVTSAGGQSYKYDKYGNMVNRGNDTLDYDVFNKPIRISGSGGVTTIDYDANHDRFREINGGTTTYTFAGGMYEEIVEGTKTTQKVYVDGVILNTQTLNNGVVASNDTLYLHTDNLGSVETISDKLGVFINRMSFSDWGKRQQSDWRTGSPASIFPTQNGYTGHHEMDQHNLVHMKGRVYDPTLGRFLSADLFIQSPYSSQSFNRYSYVANNPLSNIDLTGYECSSYRGGTKHDDGSVSWSTSWSEGDCGGGMGDNPWYHDGGGGMDMYGQQYGPTEKPQDIVVNNLIESNAEKCSHSLGACTEAFNFLKSEGLLDVPDIGDVLKDFYKESFKEAAGGLAAKFGGGWLFSKGKELFSFKNKEPLKEGVYLLNTTLGKYIGQSKDVIARVENHFSIQGKLALQGAEKLGERLFSMSGSTKIEREAYEQYLILKNGTVDNLLNVRNPMGGRMQEFNEMIDNVISKYDLPRF